MKSLKEKVEDRLIKQDQSLQRVHMLCRPKPQYNELNKVAIGYKNPLCLTRAKQVQPALYNGHEIIKDNHTPAIVHNAKDTLEIAEITRKKMNDKMNDPELVNMYVPMVSLWFATVSRQRSRFDFGRCISVIDLVVEGEKYVVDCCGLLGREVLLVEDWCRLKVWMYYDLCGKVVVAAFERNVVTNSRVAPSWREIVSLTF
nr:hypothetical protein [Tanacetum cinerariifolium]